MTTPAATNVIELASAESVDRAWQAYADHTAQGFADPKLCLDRNWMQTRARLLRRFDQLYLARCGQ